MADQLQDLLDIIHFTEQVSTRIYKPDEAAVFKAVIEEFRRSKRYNATITLLTEDGSKLKILESSMRPGLIREAEGRTSLRLKQFRIDLARSRSYAQVVREGETVHTTVGAIIGELFPGPLAALITRITRYHDRRAILTPLTRDEQIIGVFAMSSTDMAEHFVPSVRSLAQHISTALLLASEQRIRRNAEERLVWSQKMDTIGRLAGGVAHEFNNILITIRGYAELGLGTVDPSDGMARNLQKIVKGVDRATHLVDQLLVFARRQDQTPRPVNVNDVLLDLEVVLRRLMGERIDYRTKLAPDLGRVMADPSKLEQVVVNLAINARDAMPQGGRLTIETSNTTVAAETAKARGRLQPGDFVCLNVKDSGQGISQEAMEHLFEPFYSTKDLGTGLGLATCYGIVKERGGEITVTSRPGKGTTVSVYLPRVGRREAD
jgi:signal transduction histidine kinase